MWHRKRNRTVLNIVLVLLIIAVGAGMYYGYGIISALQAEQDRDLAALAVESRAQTQLSREQSYEELNAEYQKDLDTVAQYLPGIVCWGDVLTQGTASGISYTSTLQKLINEDIVNRYSFKSTISNFYDYTRIDWDSCKISIPVVNMGTGTESTYTILGRAGAIPYVTYKETTVPADCTPVAIRLQSQSEGKTVKPLINGDAGVNPVTIGGIQGTLTVDPGSVSSYSNGEYYFTRSTPGIGTVIPSGTVIKTAGTDLYRDYIHVIYVGTYGTYDDAEELASQIAALLNRQLRNPERFLVIGVCSGPISSSSFYEQFTTIMTQKYGNRFLNFRKYLMSEAMSDLGIEMSYEDKTNIRYGHMPTSLYITGSSTEFRGAVYEKLGELVYNRMESLGYFDEVREELGIVKQTETKKEG